MNRYHNTKWHITGYAMHTVAGTEYDFDIDIDKISYINS